MSKAGLCKSGLEQMHRVLSGYVERREVPGLVALVSHGDEVHVETLGAMATGDAAPMRRDAIFRIASLSKPVAAVAAMILVQECKLRLDESIEPWLPELANRRVLKSLSSPPDETTPAVRAITVRDLLTFRMGFGSVMAMPNTYPIQKMMRKPPHRRRWSAHADAGTGHGGVAAAAQFAALDGAAGPAVAVSRQR